MSGGARVLIDQAAQDAFSVDLPVVEVGIGEVAAVVFTVGDALVQRRKILGGVINEYHRAA